MVPSASWSNQLVDCTHMCNDMLAVNLTRNRWYVFTIKNSRGLPTGIDSKECL